MCIAVHPFLSGVPRRIRYLEQALRYVAAKPQVKFMTGARCSSGASDRPHRAVAGEIFR